MKAIYFFLLLTILLTSLTSYSKEDEKVIYQYKKYERFDLGNLEIKGNLIAPGDLSVKERERKQFKSNIFNRQDFFKEIERDVNELR